jgi:D-alanine-D-alanine ligase
MKVGLTYDLKEAYKFKEGDPQDANAEFDAASTIEVIAQAIRANGHKVEKIGNARDLLARIDKLNADIVFNICEGIKGRNRESEVPLLLEMYGIPFVGSDALTLGLTLDKVLTKKILISEGMPTPNYFGVDCASQINGVGLKYPLIVKPRFEGSSKGLSENSLVSDRQSLLRQTKWLIQTYQQAALVEEFISGREFTVAIIGNKKPEVLPVVQIGIDGKTELGNLFYTHSRIRSTADGYVDYLCPALISQHLQRKLQELALKVYQAVDCRDFGRVDFRVDKRGKPYILEINPLPSLSTEDVFQTIANYQKISYEAMIGKILKAAFLRYDLLSRKKKCPTE